MVQGCIAYWVSSPYSIYPGFSGGTKDIKVKEKIYLITQAAADKKADDIVVLDMGRFTQICGFFVIVSGNSTRQVRAICDNIEEQTRLKGITPLHIEGYNAGTWVLLDYFDIVVHVFIREARDFYNLERLWQDAQTIDLDLARVDNA